MRSIPNAKLAYVLLRLSFGVNLAMHGIHRLLTGVSVFALLDATRRKQESP